MFIDSLLLYAFGSLYAIRHATYYQYTMSTLVHFHINVSYNNTLYPHMGFESVPVEGSLQTILDSTCLSLYIF